MSVRRHREQGQGHAEGDSERGHDGMYHKRRHEQWNGLQSSMAQALIAQQAIDGQQHERGGDIAWMQMLVS